MSAFDPFLPLALFQIGESAAHFEQRSSSGGRAILMAKVLVGYDRHSSSQCQRSFFRIPTTPRRNSTMRPTQRIER